ncbi:MAG TPA: ABC transporter substrate-binding protein [Gemmatimonadales bacterium]|nr:ABC transporter substrate-binding protein [Gemmatimonadales bacterium]
MGQSYRALALLALAACGCSSVADRRSDTVMFASGADLQSINPLLTLHPLARQVQRYVLFTTLVQYDSAMQVAPYLARRWEWSPDRRQLTLTLSTELRWHDGMATTARDAAWTLDAARDSVTGYPRLAELAALLRSEALDDSTLVLEFSRPQERVPDVLTDLAVLPRHLLDSIPHGELRRAAFNEQPVGNGPFRFVAHEPNRRWVFERNPDFPESLGGPPVLARFIVVVVDEPMTKLAALTSGELDFAGIQPAHADFVRRNPELAVVTYPLLFSYSIVLNTRRPPFDDLNIRRRIAAAVDRAEIVNGYLFGFGTPSASPVPPSLMSAVEPPSRRAAEPSSRPAAQPIPFELLTVGSGEAALEQLLQAQLAKAGFEVRIRQLELSAFLERVRGRVHDFDAAVLGVPGDPELGHLAPLYQLSGLPAPAATADLVEQFAELVPVVFLYHAQGLQGMNRRVHHVRMDLRGELPTVARWSTE